MHLTPELTAGMTYQQRMLLERFNVEVMILREELKRCVESQCEACKKSPNIRYSFGADWITIHSHLDDLNALLNNASRGEALARRRLFHLADAVAGFVKLFDAPDGVKCMTVPAEPLREKCREIMEVLHLVNQLR